MESKKTSYLADSKWIHTPWKTARKSSFDRLLDILAAGTNLMEESSHLENICPDHLLESTLKMIGRCWKLDAELETFYEDLENEVSGPLYWPEFCKPGSPTNDDETCMLFPVSFWYANLGVAYTCIVYWTVCIILWSGMVALYTVIDQISGANRAIQTPAEHRSPSKRCPICTNSLLLPPISLSLVADTMDPERLPELSYRADLLTPAHNICQSVEYFMQEEMMVQGPAMAVMPLSVIIETFKHQPIFCKEVAWARRMLERVQQRGVRIVQCLNPVK